MSDYEYKIVVVGAGGVGKSALTVRFIQGNFIERYDPTIEDSYRKQMEVNGTACMLDIMDTAGQEEYSALRDQYMKSGQGFVVVYSIISVPTFETCTNLKVFISRIKEADPDIPIVLVGNKCDLENQRIVTKNEGEALAKKWNCQFIETSAKTNLNVTEAFIRLVTGISDWRKLHPDKVPKKRRKVVFFCEHSEFRTLWFS